MICSSVYRLPRLPAMGPPGREQLWAGDANGRLSSQALEFIGMVVNCPLFRPVNTISVRHWLNPLLMAIRLSIFSRISLSPGASRRASRSALSASVYLF